MTDNDLVGLIKDYLLGALDSDKRLVADMETLRPEERIIYSSSNLGEFEARLQKGAFFTHSGLVRKMLELKKNK